MSAHSSEAQALLELVAIAGRPLPRGLFDGAAALAPVRPGELVRLQLDHLLRTQLDHRHDALLPFHDRIGELVLVRLEPEQLRARHLQLAEGLLRAGLADSERLAFHFQAAGERERAAVATLAAAEQSHAALAFDRAADLYAQALTLGVHAEAEARALRIRLAAELVEAGRLLEAGETSLAAAEGAEPGLRLALRRDAAHALIRGGHLREGQTVLAELLADERVAAPRGVLGQVGAVLVLRIVVAVWLRWRLHRPREGVATPALRHRMDLMRRATDLYFTGEALLAIYWLLRHALLAFRTADPEHQAMAFTRFAYLEGGRWGRLGPAMEARARALSEARGGAVAVHFQEGLLMTRLMQARFREVEALAAEHRRSFVAQRGLDRFGRDLHEVHRVTALSLRGELRAAQAEGPPLLGRLRERGDRAGMMMFAVSVGYLLHLCADDVAAARAHLDEASAFLAPATARTNTRLARAVIALYAGPTPTDERWIAAYHAEARRDGSLGMLLFAGFLGSVYGLALLAGFDRAGGRARLRTAARLGARLTATPTAFARGYGEALLAGVAERRGQTSAALRAWVASEAGFIEADMQMHALAARRGRGSLLAGAEGAAIVDACDAALRAQGVLRPERLVRIVAPARGLSAASERSVRGDGREP
ncbi:MAG: hypothetical protein JNK56_26995 [Myxococcales bacterium]|nr:hypothetical protein [Myxococcales bacterium]